MKTTHLLAGLTLVGAVLMTTTPSRAAGILRDVDDLPAKVRTDLRTEIDAARRETPELFNTVFSIAAHAKELDAAARAPGIPFTRQFKNLGPRAFYPLMELLVFDAHTPSNLPPSAESALRIGAIEAIGSVRDRRATPVLARLVDRSRDLDTVRASASALGRIGTDEEVRLLVKAATKAHPSDVARERAILSGMHDCRREAAARFLADRLDREADPATAVVLAKALGGVGNAWAWKTFEATSEEENTRRRATEALVSAYVRFTGDAREAAAKAILVVDHPSTSTLIERERLSASRDVLVALEALARRFAGNPTR